MADLRLHRRIDQPDGDQEALEHIARALEGRVLPGPGSSPEDESGAEPLHLTAQGLKVLLEAMPAAVGILAGNGLVHANTAFAYAFGYRSAAELIDAGGLIAASEAARAAPDGYTLMLGETGQLSIAPSSYNKLPYDPAKDFAPVSQVVSADFALLVNPQKVQARNVKDFAEWARQQKGLFMATFGAGTPGGVRRLP